MTEQEIAGLGPAFAAYLGRYRRCFLQKRTAAHFDNYCRGLLSDLPRKTVEPIALRSRHRRANPPGVPGHRTLGPRPRARPPPAAAGRSPRRAARRHRWARSASSTRPVAASGASETPGVQRQYLGCVGKVDNGIVTVHVGVAKGRFQALLDADLYLPKVWDADRERCQAAGIPDDGALSAQVADRPGSVDPAARQRHHLRLAGLRRGLRGRGAAVGSLEPGRPALRGRSAGELRGRRHARAGRRSGRISG